MSPLHRLPCALIDRCSFCSSVALKPSFAVIALELELASDMHSEYARGPSLTVQGGALAGMGAKSYALGE